LNVRRIQLEFGELHFRCGSSIPNGDYYVMFVDQVGLDMVKSAGVETLCVDGTFSITPPFFSQVLQVLAVCMGEAIVLATILVLEQCTHALFDSLIDYDPFVLQLTSKAQVLYEAALQRLQEVMHGITVSEIKTDFEAGLMNALRKVMGGGPGRARVSGCYFHYAQAIYRCVHI
jgi:hypothetical protein